MKQSGHHGISGFLPAAGRAAGLACALGLFVSVAAAQDRSAQERIVQERTAVKAGPRGWFGVTVSDTGLIDENGNPFFNGYPVVTSVEPGSPAVKAGVKPGDVLISFNNHDMKGSALALRDWLQPGSSFVVRLRREGAALEVSGVVGRRPAAFTDRVELIWSGAGGGTRTSIVSMPRQNMHVMVRTPRPMPVGLPPVLLSTFTFGGGIYPFAGAEFTALNSDLSDALGVKDEGVFVTSVAPGSPARTSGLRGGDVVLAADSIRLEDPMALVRAIRENEDHSIRLEIVRKRKQQTIVLKW